MHADAHRAEAPVTAAEPPRPEVVATARGPVEVASFGAGPAVLTLHGAMGGWDQSVLLARAIGAPGFRYVAVSRPGYLGTPLDAGRSPAEQADLCVAVLDALGIRSAAVAAVSGGGPCAVALALRHPERCWGLVLVSACTDTLHDRLPLAWPILKLVSRLPGFAERRRRALLRDPDGATRRSIPDTALRARTLADPEAGPLLLALQASVGDRMRERLPGTENDIARTREPLAFPLERVAAPTLVFHGTGDALVPVAQARAVAERVPGAELLTVEGGEHVALFTHLAAFRARAHAFLSAHAPR